MQQEYSEELHLFTKVVGDTERLDICCGTFYFCSQRARRWFEVATAEKASLLVSQFDSKQCREQFVTPLSCFSKFRCNALAIRSVFFNNYLSSGACSLILTHTGVLILLGVFPLFLKMVADIVDPKLSIIFCRLICLRLFPKCWESGNLTAIPMGAPSPDRDNYRPISINPTLASVYEKLVSHKLSIFCETLDFLLAA